MIRINQIKTLYKLYVNRALEKMMKKIKDLVKINLSNYRKEILKEYGCCSQKKNQNIKKKYIKKVVINQKLRDSNSQKMEDKNTLIYLIPHLIDWINSKIKERKNKAI